MRYELLAANDRFHVVQSFPFFWLAKLLARPFLWNGATYFSITRGRHDIIWRRDYGQ